MSTRLKLFSYWVRNAFSITFGERVLQTAIFTVFGVAFTFSLQVRTKGMKEAWLELITTSEGLFGGALAFLAMVMFNLWLAPYRTENALRMKAERETEKRDKIIEQYNRRFDKNSVSIVFSNNDDCIEFNSERDQYRYSANIIVTGILVNAYVELISISKIEEDGKKEKINGIYQPKFGWPSGDDEHQPITISSNKSIVLFFIERGKLHLYTETSDKFPEYKKFRWNVPHGKYEIVFHVVSEKLDFSTQHIAAIEWNGNPDEFAIDIAPLDALAGTKGEVLELQLLQGTEPEKQH